MSLLDLNSYVRITVDGEPTLLSQLLADVNPVELKTGHYNIYTNLDQQLMSSGLLHTDPLRVRIDARTLYNDVLSLPEGWILNVNSNEIDEVSLDSAIQFISEYKIPLRSKIVARDGVVTVYSSVLNRVKKIIEWPRDGSWMIKGGLIFIRGGYVQFNPIL